MEVPLSEFTDNRSQVVHRERNLRWTRRSCTVGRRRSFLLGSVLLLFLRYENVEPESTVCWSTDDIKYTIFTEWFRSGVSLTSWVEVEYFTPHSFLNICIKIRWCLLFQNLWRWFWYLSKTDKNLKCLFLGTQRYLVAIQMVIIGSITYIVIKQKSDVLIWHRISR